MITIKYWTRGPNELQVENLDNVPDESPVTLDGLVLEGYLRAHDDQG